MSKGASISRLAKNSGVDPWDLAYKLSEQGIDVADPDTVLSTAERKVARAIVREMRNGKKLVRVREEPPPPRLDPKERDCSLVATLSVDDVRLIHDRLCADFGASDDPIFPPGVRDPNLLESAVGRQESGFDGLMKYHDPVLNASTLLYGICSDHPFHNGNKRTALVAALAHLDKNRHTIQPGVKQRDLERLMIAVAGHAVVTREVKVGRDTELVPRRATPDEEVMAISDWFSSRVVRVSRGESSITYRELRQILARFNFTIMPGKGMKVSVCRQQKGKTLLGRPKPPKTAMSLDWPGDGKTVAIGQVKHIRETLNLREQDGVTSDDFYSTGMRIDRFINEYRQVLRRLASK